MINDSELYNYYGIPAGDVFTNQNSDDIGDLVPMNIWGYYYDNAVNWGKPLNESCYLWKIKPSAPFATNAAYNIATGNTLNIDIAYNMQNKAVPLAMAASDVSGINSDYNKGFYPDPTNRLAYDNSAAGGYQHTALFYNIVYSGFCAVPQIAVYTFDGSDTFTGRTLENLAAWINADTEKRYISYFRFDLYSGTYSNRVISEYYNEGTFRTIALPDILSDRPIPDSATVIKNAVSDSANPHEPAWVDDRIYAPFATALRREYANNYTENANNQYSVGFAQQYTPSQLRNGYGAYNGGRVTGQFFRCNTNIQEFDDVVYKWEVVIYDMTDKVFLQPGYDITSLSHNLRFMTRLLILDKKDAATIGEANARAIKHEMAYAGFYFADNATKGASDVLGSSGDGIGVYLPEIIGGVTTGNYYTGDDIKNVPYADAENVSDFEYKPELEEIGDDDGLTDTIINTGTIAAGITYYAMTTAEVMDLTTWLNTTYNPTDETQFIQDFKGTNPADYISTVMYYPFDIPTVTTGVPVTIGKLSTGVNGAKLNYEYGNMYNYGSYTFPKYGDFRDYLTKLSIIIPFCGTIELDSIVWAGREMTVKMAVDWPTGVCTAYLYRTGENGKKAIIDSVSGQVGVPLPLSSFANGSYQVAITNMLAQGAAANRDIMMSTLGAGAGVITAGVGAFTGNYKLALGGAVAAFTSNNQANAGADRLENIAYNIDHTKPTLQSVSGGSPFINCGQDYRCVIIRAIPKFAPGYDAAAYGKTTGFATCKQGRLSAISHGFTQCAAVELSGIGCTATEKSMIFNALQAGVIL